MSTRGFEQMQYQQKQRASTKPRCALGIDSERAMMLSSVCMLYVDDQCCSGDSTCCLHICLRLDCSLCITAKIKPRVMGTLCPNLCVISVKSNGYLHIDPYYAIAPSHLGYMTCKRLLSAIPKLVDMENECNKYNKNVNRYSNLPADASLDCPPCRFAHLRMTLYLRHLALPTIMAPCAQVQGNLLTCATYLHLVFCLCCKMKRRTTLANFRADAPCVRRVQLGPSIIHSRCLLPFGIELQHRC